MCKPSAAWESMYSLQVFHLSGKLILGLYCGLDLLLKRLSFCLGGFVLGR